MKQKRIENKENKQWWEDLEDENTKETPDKYQSEIEDFADEESVAI